MLEDTLWNKNGGSATIYVKDWMKLDCIMLLSIIPIIGTIAAIIIYVILGFHQGTAASIKSRIQANLAWLMIILIMSLIIVIVIAAVFILGGIK